MSRGFTLIELMVSIAIIGIVVSIFGNELVGLRHHGVDAILQERARQLLEYEAECVVRGIPCDPGVRDALMISLPEAKLEAADAGP